MGALEGRDVDGGDPLAGRDQVDRRRLLGLHPTLGRERRIAVPVDEREVLTLHMRRRLAMAQHEDLAGIPAAGANRDWGNLRGSVEASVTATN